MKQPKNPHAQALGALGGSKRVPKGLALLTPERKAEISRMGVRARRGKADRMAKKRDAEAALAEVRQHLRDLQEACDYKLNQVSLRLESLEMIVRDLERQIGELRGR